MRVLYGIFAGWLWAMLIFYAISNKIDISPDIQVLSLAIIIAGAMAGGD